jgi:hypothetical protein
MTWGRSPLWLSAIGGLLLLPGVAWVATTGMRINDDDASAALRPLTRIDFVGGDNRPLSTAFTVPDTARWTKTRKVWGAPELLIVAVEPGGRSVQCLPRMPLRVELADQKGRASLLLPHGGLYGYSDYCEAKSSLQFDAVPGDELTLKITRAAGPAPRGYLIVVAAWPYTKDKLVGLDLDKDIASALKWPSVVGSLLVLSGAGIFARNRVRRVLG